MCASPPCSRQKGSHRSRCRRGSEEGGTITFQVKSSNGLKEDLSIDTFFSLPWSLGTAAGTHWHLLPCCGLAILPFSLSACDPVLGCRELRMSPRVWSHRRLLVSKTINQTLVCLKGFHSRDLQPVTRTFWMAVFSMYSIQKSVEDNLRLKANKGMWGTVTLWLGF